MSQNHRVLLINVFFGGIITIGLNRFLFDFLLPHEPKLNLFDIYVLLDLSFFMTAFFWVVSQSVIYHELIKKYPYDISNGRFLIDIIRFSLMFIILNTSFLAHTRFFTLILTITVWHVVALVWHLWNREVERKVSIHVQEHIRSTISYACITSHSSLFPGEDVIVLGGMTQKALFHSNGIPVIKNEAGEYLFIEERIGLMMFS